jgi:primosomal protein N' (replication factor Y)
LIVHVAVPVPGLSLLTYRVPADLPRPVVGSRVVVPLGNRIVTGVVMDDASSTAIADDAVKAVKEVLDTDAFVPADVVALAQWTAEYYAAGPGDTITAVLPPMARGGRQDAHKTVRVAAITAEGLELVGRAFQVHPDGGPQRVAPRQLEALEILAGTPTGIATPELASRGVGPDAIARLARRGLVSLRADRVDRDPFDSAAARHVDLDPLRRLTTEQESALARLSAFADARRFKVALLHGVTGSGKTEIYLRLATRVRDAGRRMLMLVPEIALTPVVTSLFREAFGERVAIQHSGLSDGERHDQWQRIRRGDVDVVIGTRSAVFAPLDDIGAIVVDEEHDGSYKQEESPRYHGRDVAIVRGQRAEALVVLGSATPSMETYHNAMSGRYERLVLERRVLDRPLAAVNVVDMREEYADVGPDVVVSRALADALRARIDRKEQSLVLLNRRGFATAVFCRQCAGTMDCPNCSVSLVVHGDGPSRRARCHYCNYTMRVPGACSKCAGPYLEQAGFGTERVEAEVRRICPSARVARLDRDAIRRKGALTDILAQFRAGNLDVLVGTQMIAKGHDFPRVTLVGVISADVGLGLADFRASERTFQLLTQVVGRAGRGDEPGEAIVQTIYPGHYSIQLARDQNYRAFFEKEIAFRQAMRYPPHISMINVIVRSRTFGGAMDDGGDLVQRLRAHADAAGLRILGPAPAPLGRLRGEYRTQVLIKGPNRRMMREAVLAALASRPDLERRVVVDVDPVSVL